MNALASMTPAQKAACLRPLLDLAVGAAPALPPGERADLYEAVALAAVAADPAISAAAATAAQAIRDAEAHQLNFAALLSQPAA